MDIRSRFFVKGGTQEIIASEMRVEYGMELQIEQEEFLATMPPIYRKDYESYERPDP